MEPHDKYSVIPLRKSERSRLIGIPIPGLGSPKMMHDFGVSRDYTIILDMPFSFIPMNLAKGLPFVWFNGEEKSTIGIFPRYRPQDIGAAEDDGWLSTYVLDESQLDEDGWCRDEAVGELWVIDAKGMEDVVGRIKFPQRVPYGFRGDQRPYRVRELATGSGECGGLIGALGAAVGEMIKRWI